MRPFIVLILLLLLNSNVGWNKPTRAFQIYTNKGKAVNLDKMVKELATKKFIFFGEYHDNPIAHWLELEFMKELNAIHKSKLMLGAEMFEADNQFILDEYLHDLISATNFQNEVRLWPNYNTDYKPLVEYAKEHNIPFIASNIPRRYANMVYKQGLNSLTQLSDLAKTFIVPLDEFVFDSTVTCYKNLMGEGNAHGGAAIAKAQAIKDATMAHFILKAVSGRNVFLHFNGAYHSDNYEGIVYYLRQRVDEEKIGTITTVEQKDITSLKSANKGKADFIICIPNSMTKTH